MDRTAMTVCFTASLLFVGTAKAQKVDFDQGVQAGSLIVQIDEPSADAVNASPPSGEVIARCQSARGCYRTLTGTPEQLTAKLRKVRETNSLWMVNCPL